MIRELICIVCPKGCAMTATVQGDAVSVTGNGCPRGQQYAHSECLHPMRTVTLAVRVTNRRDQMVSVKTESPVPKEHIEDVVKRLRTVAVEAPTEVGQVLMTDVYGSRILITKAVE